jgi:hypothetical protein
MKPLLSNLLARHSNLQIAKDKYGCVCSLQDPATAVTVDTTSLEFGTCSRLSASEYQPVTVTNHTPSKIVAFFVAPLWQDAAGGPPKAVFQVGIVTVICLFQVKHPQIKD